jgi:hypothetical protein
MDILGVLKRNLPIRICTNVAQIFQEPINFFGTEVSWEGELKNLGQNFLELTSIFVINPLGK